MRQTAERQRKKRLTHMTEKHTEKKQRQHETNLTSRMKPCERCKEKAIESERENKSDI